MFHGDDYLQSFPPRAHCIFLDYLSQYSKRSIPCVNLLSIQNSTYDIPSSRIGLLNIQNLSFDNLDDLQGHLKYFEPSFSDYSPRNALPYLLLLLLQ